jgi:phosphatidylserine/phosphatidylglycerophosphate/cardiolipin synthase-like enzyme
LLSILHTKTLVVDGQTALVMTGNLNTHGGIAVDSVNMSAQMRGPLIRTLRADWASAYALSHIEAATGAAPQALGSDPVALEAEPAPGDAPHAWTGAVLTRRSRWAPWSDGAPNPQNQGIEALLGTATREIRIVNPSLGAAPIQRAILKAILERKVQVTAILSRHMNAYREHMLFGGDNAEQALELYRTLLAEGGTDAADRLTILWGATDGKTASPTYQPGNIHAKVTALDDDCLLIGSTNFNWLSFNTSRELTVALMGDGIARPFKVEVWPPLRGAAAPMQPSDLKVCGSRGKFEATCAYLKARR